MNQLFDIAMVFAPIVLFLFLLGAFFKQDMASIFYISTREDIKVYRFRSHIMLFIGLFGVNILLVPFVIVGYINDTVNDFYEVGYYILAANGVVYIVHFLYTRFTRNVFYDDGLLYFKRPFRSVAYSLSKIDEIKLEKGFIFQDLVIIAQGRVIKINVSCFHVNTLLYMIAKMENSVLTKEIIEVLYQENPFYKGEEESFKQLMEVLNND